MNWLEIADYADTALTIAQIALVVGCPVAGVTYLAGKVILKVAVKQTARLIATSVLTGVTATVCASMMGGEGGGDGDKSGAAPPGIPAEVLGLESCKLALEMTGDGQAKLTIDGTEVRRDELAEKLLLRLDYGKLKRIELQMNVSEKEFGEWWLFLDQEIRDYVTKHKPGVEFVLVGKGE
jgi:hypothetical protein